VDDIHGINAAQSTGDPMDENGHGTHVAGTAGAVTNNALGVAGVNWQVRLMALRFLGGAGEGDVADAIACYNYLVAMKGRGVNVRVANNSWGGYQRSTALRDAIARAGEHGVVSVCAAGNEGVNVDIIGMYPAAFALESSVSVAASDREDQPAKFSNYGGTRVDLAAPGVEIYSTFKDDGYATLSGTSMASPHVAGAAALLLIQTPTLTPAQVKAQLINTVDPVPAWTRKCVSGGRLNVAKALGAG
jgi:subtilisin family serine protease